MNELTLNIHDCVVMRTSRVPAARAYLARGDPANPSCGPPGGGPPGTGPPACRPPPFRLRDGPRETEFSKICFLQPLHKGDDEMKTFNLSKPVSLLLGSTFLWGVSASVFAAGTAPGVSITNQATLNYDVGGTGQTAIVSDGDTGTPGVQTTDFVVDRKVDLTVVSNGNAFVLPNSTDQALPFTLTNTGNDTHSYLLTAVPGVDASEDDFDMSSVQIYVDNGNIGTFDGADVPTQPAPTWVTCCRHRPPVPASTCWWYPTPRLRRPMARPRLYHLVAQATVASSAVPTTATPGADDPAVIDTAFADAAGVRCGCRPGWHPFRCRHLHGAIGCCHSDEDIRSHR